jgi:hypothetical protein
MSEPALPLNEDVEVLAARVDELMVVVAALGRVIEGGTAPALGIRTDHLTEAQLRDAMESVAADLVELRARDVILQERTDRAEGALDEARSRADAAQHQAEVNSETAQAWEQEAGRLAAHRDEVVSDLLAVQNSRWMRLGRSLRIVRGT